MLFYMKIINYFLLLIGIVKINTYKVHNHSKIKHNLRNKYKLKNKSKAFPTGNDDIMSQ